MCLPRRCIFRLLISTFVIYDFICGVFGLFSLSFAAAKSHYENDLDAMKNGDVRNFYIPDVLRIEPPKLVSKTQNERNSEQSFGFKMINKVIPSSSLT